MEMGRGRKSRTPQVGARTGGCHDALDGLRKPARRSAGSFLRLPCMTCMRASVRSVRCHCLTLRAVWPAVQPPMPSSVTSTSGGAVSSRLGREPIVAPAAAFRERVLRAGAPEHGASVDHDALVFETLRKKVPTDVASTSAKFATKVARRTGELSAPRFWGAAEASSPGPTTYSARRNFHDWRGDGRRRHFRPRHLLIGPAVKVEAIGCSVVLWHVARRASQLKAWLGRLLCASAALLSAPLHCELRACLSGIYRSS